MPELQQHKHAPSSSFQFQEGHALEHPCRDGTNILRLMSAELHGMLKLQCLRWDNSNGFEALCMGHG
eukprot:5274667-Amphidinium_carterae.2